MADEKEETVENQLIEVVEALQSEPRIEGKKDEQKNRFNVQLPSGSTIVIVLRMTDSVLELKNIIEEKIMIPVTSQQLFMQGIELRDGDSLQHSNIDLGSEIVLQISTKKPMFSRLLYGIVGTMLSILGALCTLVIFGVHGWAYSTQNGVTKFSFGLVGWWGHNDEFKIYSAGHGWDEQTGSLAGIGSEVMRIVSLGTFIAHLAIAAGVWKMMMESLGNGPRRFASKFTPRALYWGLQNVYIVPLIAALTLVVAVVIWSFYGAPEAYAFSTFLAGDTKLAFSYGPAFISCVMASTLSLASSVVLYQLKRFDTQIGSGEHGTIQSMKTYGSMEPQA